MKLQTKYNFKLQKKFMLTSLFFADNLFSVSKIFTPKQVYLATQIGHIRSRNSINHIDNHVLNFDDQAMR